MTSTALGPPAAASPAASTTTVTLSTGFTVLDIVSAGGQVRHRAGGTAANVVANLAWLGLRTALASRLGDDLAGRIVRQDLANSGVNVSNTRLEPAVRTPAVIHQVSTSGRHQFTFKCPACGKPCAKHRPISPDQASQLMNANVGLFFMDRVSIPALRCAQAVKSNGGLVMLEPNGWGRPQLTLRALAISDVLKVSGEKVRELQPLLDAAAPSQLQIVTRGGNGLSWRYGRGEWIHQPAYEAEVVDPGGSGDWVTAGLISFLARRQPFDPIDRQAVAWGLRRGQALAATSAGFLGARGMNYADPNETSQLVNGRLAGIEPTYVAASAPTPATEMSTADFLTNGDSCPVCLASLD